MLKSLKSYWSGTGDSESTAAETSRVSSTAETTVKVTADDSELRPEKQEADSAAENAPAASAGWSMSMSMDSAMLTSVMKPDEVRQTLSKARNFFGKLGSAALQKTTQILEENTPILSDFSREQNKFESEKQRREAVQLQNSVVPWFGYCNEDSVKKQILALSLDKRNFVRNPPGGSQFVFEINEFAGAAKLMLAEDPHLTRMRFELVPKVVREDAFWRNYFYRVSLIKQSAQLAELATMKPSSGHTQDGVSRLSATNADAMNAFANEDGATQLSGSSNTSSSFEKLTETPHSPNAADFADDGDGGEGEFVSDSHALSQTVTLSRDELAQLNLAGKGAANASSAEAAKREDRTRGGSNKQLKAEDATSGSDWSHDEFELVTESMGQSGSGQAESDSIDDELEREILAEIALEESRK